MVQPYWLVMLIRTNKSDSKFELESILKEIEDKTEGEIMFKVEEVLNDVIIDNEHRLHQES